MSNPKAALYVVTMPDGSRWAVPVDVIAINRADYYKHEFGDDLQRSLDEDTWPLFAEDDYEIKDWAANNMDWSDVEGIAVMIEPPTPPDFNEGWCNGDKEVQYQR